MIRTAVLDMLGVEAPVIQAGMGGFTSADLAAAVSEAGGMGTLGAGTLSSDRFRRELERLRALTAKPFAVNHTVPTLDEESFTLTLGARPRVVSFALGPPADRVREAHDAGSLVMQQVTTVGQALEAAEQGADIIIAQGAEAGGFGGFVGTMALVPQVVDAVRPLPVIAAGGIADGRGLAAALMLGAQGVNVGTRFLAAVEAPISAEWKQAILRAAAEDAIKVDVWLDIMPRQEGAYEVVPRTLVSPFVAQWQGHRSKAREQVEALRGQIMAAIAEGTFGELLPFTGQVAGLIGEILPAARILRDLVTEAEIILAKAGSYVSG